MRKIQGTALPNSIEKLEEQLDSFDFSKRKKALRELWGLAQCGDIKLGQICTDINLHFHTFYSYNACGYSPSKIAWLARKAGLGVVGIIDFDVFDGLDEFFEAAELLGLKGCGGMETRVYVPEFADRVINSLGEPGISYHIGIGFPIGQVSGELQGFKTTLRKTVEQRNMDLVGRVNSYLAPVRLDYEKDVCPLTPSGNATERHICLAYARKARSLFTNERELSEFWADRLQTGQDSLDLPEGLGLLNLIRAKTMKRGGTGYVQPDAGLFPTMAETNRFILAAGGIPTLAWLDGTSDGEREIEKLLEVAISSGTSAVNIIPERNFTAGLGKNDRMCKNLYDFVALAEKMDLPIVVGTEMNSPGQKFVDDFNSVELAPLLPVFLKGAHIVYAHCVLQRQCGLGYTSQWAKNIFQTTAAKNNFFEKIGNLVDPANKQLLNGLSQSVTAQQILDRVEG